MALKISLFSVRPGAVHHPGLETLVQDYLKRCGKALPASARVFRTEAALLSAVTEERRAGATLFVIADIGGLALNTLQLSERFRTARDNGLRHMALAIGPANGWSAQARATADLRLSLSELTMPHELAWLLLAEQIYRASTILQGHPYHLGH